MTLRVSETVSIIWIVKICNRKKCIRKGIIRKEIIVLAGCSIFCFHCFAAISLFCTHVHTCLLQIELPDSWVSLSCLLLAVPCLAHELL